MKRITLKNKKNSLTFKEGFEEYIDNCKARNLREATIKHYQESFISITKFISEDTLIKDFNKNTVPNFVIDCKENLQINDITLHTYARDLKTLMYFFMRNDYLQTFKIDLPKTTRTPIECYTDNELKVLLKKPDLNKATFPEYRDWVIINFLMSVGVRLNSFINIKIKDLDLENEVVHVIMTKNRRPLIIPLNKSIIKILKEYLKFRDFETEEEYLFCNVYGKQLTKNTISESLRQYNIKRKIVKTGIHRYRHTFAKKWIMAGGSVTTLQKILGHSSLTMTENYINLLVEDLKKDVNQFNLLEEFSQQKHHIKVKK
ncbi:tyrosine-type recombinase/integrase [Clostridium massiliamazoniense]|uniref:tyrosine-type recombinase/integrase n=1 Tax=Clostridium massiliamazoniense TaxID=1347366 RepID=UPI0006D832DC|nr:tyrosine-type recombinase/integrase [Clostridium massiliamazoniense]